MEYVARKSGSDEIIHYGVKGMKWGVRKEVRKDFKSDKQRGRDLTRYAGYAREAYKESVKKNKKYNTTDTQKNEKMWKRQYDDELNALKSHVDEMVKKYGHKHVKSITYKKVKLGKNRVERLMRKTELSKETKLASFLVGGIIGTAIEMHKYNDYKKRIESSDK